MATPKTSKENLDELKLEEMSLFVDERGFSEKLYQISVYELNLKEKSEILGFRKKWSSNLLWLVVIIVIFNGLFLLAIGRDLLQYHDEWLVRIIFAGSFIEVLGLAKIVVEFLFKEPPKTA